MRLKASSGFPLAPEGRGADHSKMQKSKIAKIRNFKNCKSQKRKSKNFHRIFFREIDHEIVSRKIVFLFPSSRARLSSHGFLAFFASSQCARCKLNAGKQCPL